jgi:hypothetical protein
VRTFIVRLQEDTITASGANAASARLRGVVAEVVSGLHVIFRNDDELVTALQAAVTADLPGAPWTGDDRATRQPTPRPAIEEK